ncbi:hypothetical protein FGG08_007564 [Glutinoglossum americanum]|uniref:Oxidoreductase n=1 Tax=Glutinoglossum americanum TaxID=1670608 RepID=A0A9P8I324_9PEZI|nr:hypothetical protein FGG08_007564 [Glutinoglossum americanum]
MSLAKPTAHNVSVIGYGLSARIFHIPLILSVPGLRLHSIVQRHPKPGNDAREDFRDVRWFGAVEEALRDGEVDVVVVCTVPEAHFEVVKGALERGKHVVVEKPFTTTVKEADELIALAKKHSRLLTVYHNRRWDSDFLTLQNLLRTHTLGRIASFSTHFDRHRPNPPPSTSWKSRPSPANSAIYDLGTHLIDQAVVLFGMPAKITGFLGSQREGGGGVEDSCSVVLQWEGGLVGRVEVGVVSLEVEQARYWVRGTEGTLRKYHLDPQEDQLKAGKRPGDPGFGVEPPDRYGTLTTLSPTTNLPTRTTYPTISPPATYTEFYRLFAKALAGEGEVPVRPEEARDVICLVELARESSRVGRTLDVDLSV